MFKKALKCAENAYRKSLQAQEQGHNMESLHSKLIIYLEIDLFKILKMSLKLILKRETQMF
jgi:hypothetical protein